MSTTTNNMLAEDQPATIRRLFRGDSDEQLIPGIEAELGTDAIVVARRSGLTGGVAGFFQRPFVEIEAEAGHPGIDLYDGEPVEPTIGDPLSSSEERLAETFRELLPTSFGPKQVPVSPPAAFADPPASVGDSFQAMLAAIPDPTATTATTAPEPSPTPEPLAPEPSPEPAHVLAPEPSPTPEPLAPEPAHVLAPEPSLTPEPVHVLAPGVVLEAYPRVDPEPSPPASHASPAVMDLPAQMTDERSRESRVATECQSLGPRARPRTKVRASLEESLLETGMSEGFAGRLIDGAAAHLVPLDPRAGLAKAVRRALQSHIPVLAPLPAGGATVVLVGPGGSGKTGCAKNLVDAYERSGGLSADLATIHGNTGRGGLELQLHPEIQTPISVSAPRAMQALMAAGNAGMTIVDTPALSPGDRGAIRELGTLLAKLSPERIVVALPATLGGRAANQLLTALRPLGATALAITHADETDQLGVAVEAACEFGLAPEFLVERSRGHTSAPFGAQAGGRTRVTQVSPAELTERLLG